MKVKEIPGIPTGFVKIVEKNIRELEKPNVFHVTELVGQNPIMRKIIRDNWDKIEVDPRKYIAALNGITAHAIFEKFLDKEKEVAEVPLGMSFGNFSIIGRLDLLQNIRLEGDVLHATLADHKTTSVNALRYQAREGVKDEWVLQTNIYRYILMKNFKEEQKASTLKSAIISFLSTEDYPPDVINKFERAKSMVIDKIFIHAYAMDWKPYKQYSTDYPEFAIISIPIEVFPLKDVEKYIEKRIEAFQHPENYELKDEDIWVRPWAVVPDGYKRAVRYLTTSEMLEMKDKLPKGQHLEFRGDIYIEDPNMITRCAYCPAKNVCMENAKKKGVPTPAVRLIIKEAKLAESLKIPRVRDYTMEAYLKKKKVIE